nr:subtilisin-like protease SBT1.2 [Tanacetum cinerariifolium]
MENLDGVLFVSPEKSYELHTTHSPRFLGLHQNKGVCEDSHYGKGIVIALLDSGITPGHPSFDDKGIPPPPLRWKGKREVSGCNNKLIGIRNFVTGDSAIDNEGHGTHTSSTATGNYVNNASVFEQANGTATSDILAGMDTAIEDGADVISLSLGGPPVTFYNDPIAICAFTAIKSGIFVSCSAGNFGPHNKTLLNEAPWILTVGASKTDRRIRTTVTLGNKKMLNGEALYQPKTYKPKVRPLVYPAGMGFSCSREELKLIDVKGKIVLCDAYNILMGSAMGAAVKKAGGAAIIFANNKLTGNSVAVEVQVLPSSHVGYREGVAIKKYLNSTSAPVATIIQHGTVLGVKSAPQTVTCSKTIPEAQLNYPSFVVELKRCERKEYTRILTNVGWENSTYTIGDISLPQGVDIEVLSHSQQLSFTALHQKLPLRVIFARVCKDRVNVPYFYDFTVLESGKYSVRIPYVIMYK